MYRKDLEIPVENFHLKGELVLPPRARGIVIFCHGGGSSRLSPRLQHIARSLYEHQFGTLLFNLLNEREAGDYDKRFNMDLLTRRLITIGLWTYNHSDYKQYPLGFFGAGTGAAAALNAAARMEHVIQAVVCQSGQLELVGSQTLKSLQSPIMLVAGELDFHGLGINRKAVRHLQCPYQLVIVPGANQLIEETGKIDMVARSAGSWFSRYLGAEKHGRRIPFRFEEEYD